MPMDQKLLDSLNLIAPIEYMLILSKELSVHIPIYSMR